MIEISGLSAGNAAAECAAHLLGLEQVNDVMDALVQEPVEGVDVRPCKLFEGCRYPVSRGKPSIHSRAARLRISVYRPEACSLQHAAQAVWGVSLSAKPGLPSSRTASHSTAVAPVSTPHACWTLSSSASVASRFLRVTLSGRVRPASA